jgi:hypothetical protein
MKARLPLLGGKLIIEAEAGDQKALFKPAK